MMILNFRPQSLVAAVAAITFSLFSAHHAAASQPEVVLASTLTMNSTSFVDSFDSSDPGKSTNGLYDPSKSQAHGDVGILNNVNSDLRNGFIFGSLEYSGTAPKNSGHVQGPIFTPFNAPMPAATDPTWVSGSYTSYTGASASASKVFTAGTQQLPALIKVNGDFNLPGGSTFHIVPRDVTPGYIQIWVTGKFTASGSGRLLQDPNVQVTWIVDKDITTNGDTYKNGSGKASNLSFVGVGTGKVNVNGFGNLVATVTGPSRDVAVSGGGSLSGGVTGKTLNLGGNSSVHSDEALLAQ